MPILAAYGLPLQPDLSDKYTLYHTTHHHISDPSLFDQAVYGAEQDNQGYRSGFP
jgi:hypothetical protein